MICELSNPVPEGERLRYRCPHCGREVRLRERIDPATVKAACGAYRPRELLSAKERKDLFGDEADPTLLGNRIAALTAAIGIPPCGSCTKRKAWLNRAHEWLRATAGSCQPNGS